MKINKILCGVALFCATLTTSLTSCQQGLTCDEAPENVYSEVGVSDFKIYGRQLFENQMWAKNWDKWVDNTLLNSNTLSSGFNITEEANEEAPGGKLYVINVNCAKTAKYTTPNNGYLFVASKFSGNFELEDPSTLKIENKNESTSRYVILPVNKQEVVCELHLVDAFNCYVDRVDGAPALGTPADFTQPARYLVRNICYRPAGVEEVQRLYEVRVTFKDQQ